jgi:hypothetical protein
MPSVITAIRQNRMGMLALMCSLLDSERQADARAFAVAAKARFMVVFRSM